MPAVDFFVPFAVAHSKDAFLSSSARIFGQKELHAANTKRFLWLQTYAPCACVHILNWFFALVSTILSPFFSPSCTLTCYELVLIPSGWNRSVFSVCDFRPSARRFTFALFGVVQLVAAGVTWSPGDIRFLRRLRGSTVLIFLGRKCMDPIFSAARDQATSAGTTNRNAWTR